MKTIVVILYIVCFGCYILFTRQPDYFEGQFAPGTIVRQGNELVAEFSDGSITRYANVPYRFLQHPGRKVQVIYEASDPSKAKVYGVLGYWITFGELIASLVIVVALYYVAVSITSNPTPEALIEELEATKKKPRKPRYDS